MKLVVSRDNKFKVSTQTEKSVKLFDTTLRDGTQSESVSFSVEGKIRIAQKLDEFGIDYIEGGWPGSNPKDIEFFKRIRQIELNQAKIVAFGSTRYKSNSADDDPNIAALLSAETPAVLIFGKSWAFQVENALHTTLDNNLKMINDSIAFAKSRGREVVYDAEHFFDGYEADPEYAIQSLLAAVEGGADVLVLCDTNGGSLPSDVGRIVSVVRNQFAVDVGIHAHNDSELAVANALAAVESGAVHVQGTINGYGERCGNTNLCSIIPNLQMKLGKNCVEDDKIEQLTALSHLVSEVANLRHQKNSPYVGKSAFTHKGGIHVSAVMRDSRTYEHIHPEMVGNRRRVVVSELSGKSNLLFKAEELNIDLEKHNGKVADIVADLKHREYSGYLYEAAEGSLELLVKKITGEWKEFFELGGFRILIEKDKEGNPRSEATIRLTVDGVTEHIATEGTGPVHALDSALRKALIKFFPDVKAMKLDDYKVRVLNNSDGTAAKVRVLIDFTEGDSRWGTVGVSENIIEASWQALLDGYSYYLHVKKDSKQNVVNL